MCEASVDFPYSVVFALPASALYDVVFHLLDVPSSVPFALPAIVLFHPSFHWHVLIDDVPWSDLMVLSFDVVGVVDGP